MKRREKMKYEYLILSPNIINDRFENGYTAEKEKTFFGKEKIVYKDKTITEQEWLNKKGQEGWELVNILRNGMNYDLREYYFKRKIK